MWQYQPGGSRWGGAVRSRECSEESQQPAPHSRVPDATKTVRVLRRLPDQSEVTVPSDLMRVLLGHLISVRDIEPLVDSAMCGDGERITLVRERGVSELPLGPFALRNFLSLPVRPPGPRSSDARDAPPTATLRSVYIITHTSEVESLDAEGYDTLTRASYAKGNGKRVRSEDVDVFCDAFGKAAEGCLQRASVRKGGVWASELGVVCMRYRDMSEGGAHPRDLFDSTVPELLRLRQDAPNDECQRRVGDYIATVAQDVNEKFLDLIASNPERKRHRAQQQQQHQQGVGTPSRHPTRDPAAAAAILSPASSACGYTQATQDAAALPAFSPPKLLRERASGGAGGTASTPLQRTRVQRGGGGSAAPTPSPQRRQQRQKVAGGGGGGGGGAAPAKILAFESAQGLEDELQAIMRSLAGGGGGAPPPAATAAAAPPPSPAKPGAGGMAAPAATTTTGTPTRLSASARRSTTPGGRVRGGGDTATTTATATAAPPKHAKPSPAGPGSPPGSGGKAKAKGRQGGGSGGGGNSLASLSQRLMASAEAAAEEASPGGDGGAQMAEEVRSLVASMADSSQALRTSRRLSLEAVGGGGSSPQAETLLASRIAIPAPPPKVDGLQKALRAEVGSAAAPAASAAAVSGAIAQAEQRLAQIARDVGSDDGADDLLARMRAVDASEPNTPVRGGGVGGSQGQSQQSLPSTADISGRAKRFASSASADKVLRQAALQFAEELKKGDADEEEEEDFLGGDGAISQNLL